MSFLQPISTTARLRSPRPHPRLSGGSGLLDDADDDAAFAFLGVHAEDRLVGPGDAVLATREPLDQKHKHLLTPRVEIVCDDQLTGGTTRWPETEDLMAEFGLDVLGAQGFDLSRHRPDLSVDPKSEEERVTKVTITGTGRAPVEAGRAGSGVLVEHGDVVLQFDAGRATALRMAEAGVLPAQLDAYDEDIAVRVEHTNRSHPAPTIIGFDAATDPTEVWRSADGEVWVTAVAVHHQPVDPAVAYRVDTPDGSVVISGDTRVCDDLDSTEFGPR